MSALSCVEQDLRWMDEVRTQQAHPAKQHACLPSCLPPNHHVVPHIMARPD